MDAREFFVGMIIGFFAAMFIASFVYFFTADADKEIYIYQQDQMLECTNINEGTMECSVKQ